MSEPQAEPQAEPQIEPQTVLDFWLKEVGVKGWYAVDAAVDQAISDRFQDVWQQAKNGTLSKWLGSPEGALAFLIVVDQFPRNMFRDDKRAFSTDWLALEVSKCAVKKGWDMKIEEPQRQFFYLPMMHSENLCDQERCVRLMLTRMPNNGAPNLLHAKVHREVIRKFGRFPYRNDAMARETTKLETAFFEEGGYGTVLDRLSA